MTFVFYSVFILDLWSWHRALSLLTLVIWLAISCPVRSALTSARAATSDRLTELASLRGTSPNGWSSSMFSDTQPRYSPSNVYCEFSTWVERGTRCHKKCFFYYLGKEWQGGTKFAILRFHLVRNWMALGWVAPLSPPPPLPPGEFFASQLCSYVWIKETTFKLT